MKKTFLQLALARENKTQAWLARELGWTHQRVGYLVGPKCRGFPFDSLWHLKQVFRWSDRDLAKALDAYFNQD